MLLDQVASESGETVTIPVTVKHRAEAKAEKDTGLCGITTRSMLQTDVHHAAQKQAKEMEIGKVGGVDQRR
jgi:hypothetical protein